jgi:hypothetical protein
MAKQPRPTSRWKRIRRRIGVSASLGLLLTIALAWVPAFYHYPRVPPPNFPVRKYLGVSDGHTFGVVEHRWPYRRQYMMYVQPRSVFPDAQDIAAAESAGVQVLPDWVHWRGSNPDLYYKGEDFMECTEGWGWPFPALRRTVRHGVDDKLRTNEAWILADNPADWFGYSLPTGILWTGLIADTAILSVALGALVLTFGFLRAFRRRRKGLCPSCAYDRHGLSTPAAPCPECGAPP